MLQRDCVTLNTIISGYAKNGNMEGALRLLNSMPERNAVSWNATISGLLQNGDVERAIGFFEQMPDRDCALLGALVFGLIQNGELDEAVRVLVKYGSSYAGRGDLVLAYNTFIASYGQKGRVEEAWKVFNQIPMINDQGKEGDVRFKRNILPRNLWLCCVKAGYIVGLA